MKTEINAVRIGDIEIITSPGEMFPEIVDGGIETPEGADIKTDPVETPPLRTLMKGKINMNFNLGMDEIGYVIPISQWDRKKPLLIRIKRPHMEKFISVIQMHLLNYTERVSYCSKDCIKSWIKLLSCSEFHA